MKARRTVVDPQNNLSVVVIWILPALPVVTHKPSLGAATRGTASPSLLPITLLGQCFSFNKLMTIKDRGGTGGDSDR